MNKELTIKNLEAGVAEMAKRCPRKIGFVSRRRRLYVIFSAMDLAREEDIGCIGQICEKFCWKCSATCRLTALCVLVALGNKEKAGA